MFQGCPVRSCVFYLAIERTVMVLSMVFFTVSLAYGQPSFSDGQSSSSVQSAQLNGISKYTHLGEEQFLAGLFSESLTSSNSQFLRADESKRLEIKVLAPSISPRFFRQLWIETVAINTSTNDLTKHAQNLADFSNFLKPRMRAGDILVIDRTEDRGVIVTLNNTHLGSVADKTFFELLARSWVGSVPLSSKFRDELLKAGDISVDLRSDYLSVFPSDDRIEEIKAFVSNEEKNQNNKKLIANTQNSPGEAPAAKEPVKVVAPIELASVAKVPIKKPVLSKPVLADVKPVAPEIVPEAVTEQNNISVAGDSSDENVLDDVANEAVDEEDSPDFVYTAQSLLAKQLYIAKLSRWTFPFIKYPTTARRNEQEGSLTLKVVIARDGEVVDISIIEESGFSILDKAATAAVKKASPYPPIPDDIRDNRFAFNVPIMFSLKQ